MKQDIKKIFLCGCCLFPLALTSCQTADIWGPNSMPRGYAPLHKEVKTIVPDRPYFIGPEYSTEDVAESEMLWRQAVNTLINKLEDNAVMNGLSVSLHPSRPDNSFDVRMDYYLRQALKERGYLIVTEALPSVPVLRYKARLPGYQMGLQQKGRMADQIDDIQKEFDVHEDPHNEGRPYVFLGLGIYDISLPKHEQELLFVEVEQNLHKKDLHEIRGALIDPPLVAGVPETSNLNQ